MATERDVFAGARRAADTFCRRLTTSSSFCTVGGAGVWPYGDVDEAGQSALSTRPVLCAPSHRRGDDMRLVELLELQNNEGPCLERTSRALDG